jgi:hypothetical protein
MSVRSTPLQQAFAVPTSVGLCISGLPGRTKIIKQLIISSFSGSDRQAIFFLNGTATADTLLIVDVPANKSVNLTDQFIVLLEDDELYVDASGSGLILSAFGANLEGNPT